MQSLMSYVHRVFYTYGMAKAILLMAFISAVFTVLSVMLVLDIPLTTALGESFNLQLLLWSVGGGIFAVIALVVKGLSLVQAR